MIQERALRERKTNKRLSGHEDADVDDVRPKQSVIHSCPLTAFRKIKDKSFLSYLNMIIII